jgi:hypothetical protein
MIEIKDNQNETQRILNANHKYQNHKKIPTKDQLQKIENEEKAKKLKMKEIDCSSGKNTADQSWNNISPPLNLKNKQEIYQKKHQEKLNEILISNYGTEIYDFCTDLENRNYFPRPLENHKIDPDIRTKMVDWMLEVLSAYNSEIFTFNLSVQIMDMYVSKCKSVLSNNDVHLIGIVSMFIASKMEDICPIRMSHVRTKIAHGKFSEKDIRKKEKMVLEALNFDIITTSTSDFIKTFLYDFIHNNRPQIEKLEMWHHIDAFENVTIFLSKLIQHSVNFNQYK